MLGESRILRLHSHGGIAAWRIAELVADVDYAYNGLTAFDSALRGMTDYREPSWLWAYPWRRRGPAALVLERADVASLVHPRQRLRLHAVRLESPGFWDFLGKSASVEAISDALNDRQARREARDRAPHERVIDEIEEYDRATDALLNRYRALKEMGAPQEDLALLRNQLVERPMRTLGRHQDAGLITDVEVIDVPERPGLTSGNDPDES